ncbi:MAG: bifunctional 4-hydroxy-2-oxoglutarate aldolase/2-dehydro-3-deoxy-phosphogluconate aldolase [Clostridia bacterium]|nr:bifunctional 4-hydroxy-2-oxoglutarate aldolase/2-dehydro-3-deoxy-phosphogluconate aldolase [Clostridia bacterium]
MDILKKLGDCGVIPVVVIENPDMAVETARALYAGGIDVIEITLRTPTALDSIRAISRAMPCMLTGAGTALNCEQTQAALDAGAKFIVSPGLDREQALFCAKNGVPLVPGCVTPGEIMAARSLGLDILKFFPASVYGGLSAIKALSAPFSGIKFIPTGGVSISNLIDYARSPAVFAVGGSWLCTADDIKNACFDKITELSKDAVKVWHSVDIRNNGGMQS